MKNNSVLILLVAAVSLVFFMALRQRFSGSDAFPDRGGQTYAPTSNVRYSSPASRSVGVSLPREDRFASVSTASGSSLPRGGTVASTRGTVASVSTASGSSLSQGSSHRMVSLPIQGHGTGIHTSSQSTLHSYGGSASVNQTAASSASNRRTTSTAAYSVSAVPSLAINSIPSTSIPSTVAASEIVYLADYPTESAPSLSPRKIPSGSGSYAGETRTDSDGVEWQWNGYEWVRTTPEPDMPLGDGLWFMLLLAMLAVAVKSAKCKVQSSKCKVQSSMFNVQSSKFKSPRRIDPQ